MKYFLLAFALSCAADLGCGDERGASGVHDAGRDARVSTDGAAGLDAGHDASLDGGVDASRDAAAPLARDAALDAAAAPDADGGESDDAGNAGAGSGGAGSGGAGSGGAGSGGAGSGGYSGQCTAPYFCQIPKCTGGVAHPELECVGLGECCSF